MPRKRYKKSHAKTRLPALQQARKTSPAAQVVVNRIASGGAEYLMQNAIRIMTDSGLTLSGAIPLPATC